MPEEDNNSTDEVVQEERPVQEEQPAQEDFYVEIGHKKLKADSAETKQAVIDFYNTLKKEANRAKSLESEVSQARNQLKALNSEKELFSSHQENKINEAVNEAVSKYHNKLIDMEIKTSLTSNPKFLNNETTLNDAVKLLKSDNKFLLDENSVTTEDGISVSELVNNFLESREQFQKAPESVGFNKTTKTVNGKLASQTRKRDLKSVFGSPNIK